MKMVGKKSHNLMKNLIAGFIAVALLVSGVCFFGTDSSLVMASDLDVKTEDGGYAVKPYSAADFAEFRGDTYTYPKLTAADGSNYQEWLFAGWFTNSTCTTPVGSNVKTVEGEVYAKFVDADLSYIKCQVTPGTDVDSEQAHMRVISTVDSKYYSETGFYITYKDRGAKKYPTDNVYRRLSATEDGMECGYSPIAFNEDAEYLFALRLTGIGNANFDEAFYIQSYWETLDGTEVLGMSRYARVEDSYEKIVNVPVRLYASDVEVTTGSVSVTYDANQFSLYKTDEYPNGYDNGKGFTVTNVDSTTTSGKLVVKGTADNGVAEGLIVNLRLQLKKDATLESYTEFTVDGETFVNGETSVTGLDVPNVIFKNYPVAYTAGTVDTSWYKGFEDNNTFVISSAADLYGLASIVNATDGEYKNEQFSGDTIILGSDITINTAILDPEADGWDATGDSYIPWTPIGNDKNFQGTFDGKGHEIKGVYVTGDTTLLGLFGYVNGENAMVTDLSLTNSYVEHTGGTVFVGGVVGYLNKGTIDKVYSNAIVQSNGAEFGGIVGRAEGLVEECWFDGEVYANRIDAAYVKAAGIVGTSWSQTGTGKTFTPLTIRNCLNTGSVTYNVTTTSGAGAGLGGIYGGDRGYTDLTVEYCINTGVIETNQKNGTGSIVGNISQNTTIDSVKTYSTADITNCYGATNTISTRTDGRILGYNNANCTVTQTDNVTQDAENMNGHVAYDTIKGGLSVLTGQVKDGAWAIREQSSNLKDGVPVPVAFADEWIDVAWYYGSEKSDDKGETYSISTAEELYGFSAISRGYTFGEETIQGYNFDGDTIQLANDITVNDGKATSWEKGTIPSREWTPIGNSITSFQGTFDGQKHFIKGIYVNATTQNAGLFGYAEDATIQDLQLINSYIHSTVDRVGGIAGYYTGDMYRVYCNAIVVSTRNATSDCGGLIGYYEKIASTDEISKCWFAGTAKGYTRTGGIVGYLRNGRKEISDTLVTGTVISTTSARNAQAGGIVGSINDYAGAVVEINSSIGAGTMQDSYTGTDGSQIGGVVGYKAKNGTVTINNVYTTFSKGLGTQNNTSGTSAVEDDYTKIDSIDEIKGSDVYTNDVMNLGYYMYDSTWVARKTDIPVPRCFVGTVVDENDIVEDTSAHTAWYDADPDAKEFELKTENDLLGFAEIVNASEGDYASEQFSGQKIKLAKDMDLNRGWSAPETADDEVKPPTTLTWTPIGNDKSFQGTFDGQGHEIKGIYVTGDSTLLGLFGYVNGVNAMIKNLRLTNSYVEHIGATVFVGGVVGYLNKGTINQVYCKAIVKSNGAEFGGIVGRAEGLVEECWFDGEVYANRTDATYVKAAGIVGTSWSQTGTGKTFTPLTIRNCLNTGNVIYTVDATSGLGAGLGGIYGGDRGYTDVTVEYCLNTGVIETNQKNGTGSIVGNISQNTTINSAKTYSIADITNCYGTPNTISTRTDGRIFGYNNANCTVTQTDNKTIDEEMIFGLGAQLLTTLDFVQDADETIWAARRGQIPAPAGLVADSDKLNVRFGKADTDIADGATGNTAEDPYIIENVEELYGFAVLSRENNFADKYIKLSDNIDVIDVNPGESAEDWAKGTAASLPWYSIGDAKDELRFAGHFDGNGKTISGIYMNDDNSYLGLFAATETGSTITNLRLMNSYFNYTGNGTAYTGSIVGDLRGDMTNVYSDAIVNSNGTQTGGLIGQVNEVSEDGAYAVDINNCWYNGQLTSSKTYAGGLLASTAKGTVNVDNCLNTGTIITTATATNVNNAVAGICAQVNGASTVTITDTIAAGKIADANHGKNVKSVVGYIPDGTVNFENVFATKFAYGRALPSEGASGAHAGTVIRTHKANRLIGYCVGEIKTGETAPKLDFVTDWTIRTTDVPVPTCFADLVTPVTFAEGSTLDATLNTQIGLDTLGLSIVNAIDMGEGNYVLETTADDTLYSNYVAKLEDDLGFGNPVAENSAGAGADGVHSVSYKKQNPDWVLTLTYVETTDVLTISINTDIDSLSDNLVYTEGVEDEDYMATGDITFSMLQMKEYTVDAEGKEIPVDAIYADLYLPKYFLNENSYWYGNSFVFQLPNGHFIVNDGGAREEFADLVTYLKTAAGTTEDGVNPVYIDAWIVSHQHGDHFDVIRAASDALRDETSTLMDDIYVDAFYINEPNAKVLANASLDDDVDSQYNGMTLFTKGPDGEQADIYRMQTGQRYYFNGLVMDVIQAQEQIPYSNYGKFNASSSEPDFNTVSTVTLFTTSNNQKILIGGDANYANMQYIMDAYGIENEYTKSALLKNINVFVAFHHGKNMSMNINGSVGYGFIDYLTKDGSQTGHLFDYVLYPCSLVYGDHSDPAYAFPNAGEANAYLNSKANAFEHFGNGNVEITLKGATTE